MRAGNEKEEGETADTVGCCSLRVEHIKLYPKMDDQEYVVEFDFLGKDSIRYYNKMPVEKRVRRGGKRGEEWRREGTDGEERRGNIEEIEKRGRCGGEGGQTEKRGGQRREEEGENRILIKN